MADTKELTCYLQYISATNLSPLQQKDSMNFSQLGLAPAQVQRLRVSRIYRTDTDPATGNSCRPQRPRPDRLC